MQHFLSRPVTTSHPTQMGYSLPSAPAVRPITQPPAPAFLSLTFASPAVAPTWHIRGPSKHSLNECWLVKALERLIFAAQHYWLHFLWHTISKQLAFSQQYPVFLLLAIGSPPGVVTPTWGLDTHGTISHYCCLLDAWPWSYLCNEALLFNLLNEERCTSLAHLKNKWNHENYNKHPIYWALNMCQA